MIDRRANWCIMIVSLGGRMWTVSDTGPIVSANYNLNNSHEQSSPTLAFRISPPRLCAERPTSVGLECFKGMKS